MLLYSQTLARDVLSDYCTFDSDRQYGIHKHIINMAARVCQQLFTLHLFSGDCFAPTIPWHASELLLAVNFDPRSMPASSKTKKEGNTAPQRWRCLGIEWITLTWREHETTIAEVIRPWHDSRARRPTSLLSQS